MTDDRAAGSQGEGGQPEKKPIGEKEIEDIRQRSARREGGGSRFLEKLKPLVKANRQSILTAALLLGVFLLAFWIRAIPARYNEMPGLDEFYFYRLGLYALEHNLQLPETDTFRFHPIGVKTYENEFILPVYLPVVMYLLTQWLGMGMHWLTFVLFYPPFMGALASVAMFFLGRELYDERAGLLASLFLATSPAFLARTTAGIIEKEAGIAPFTVLTILLFLWSFRRRNPAVGALCGLSLAVMGMTSALTQYFYLILAAFAFLLLLLNRETERLAASYLPAVVIGLFLPPLLVPHNLSIANYTLPPVAFSFLVAVILAVRLAAERRRLLKPDQLPYLAPGIAVLLVLGFFAATIVSDEAANILNSAVTLLTLAQRDPIGFTVAENQPGSWNNVVESLSTRASDGLLPQLSPVSPYLSVWMFMILGGLIMGYKVVRNREWRLVMCILWLISGIWAVFFQIRLLFILGPAAALLAGYALSFLITNVMKLRSTGPQALRNIARYSPFYLLAVVALVVIVNTTAAYAYTSSQGSSICITNPAILIEGKTIRDLFGREIVEGKCLEIVDGSERYAEGQPWYQAFTFMSTQTPEGSNFISWWDFGYWFQTRGKRPSVSDGGFGPRHEIATWFTAETKRWGEFESWLRDNHSVDYIFMDYTLPGKYGAITAIASRGASIIGFQQFNPGQTFQQDNTTVQEFTAGQYAIWVPLREGNLAGSPILLVSEGGQYVQNGFINDVCTTQGILHAGDRTPSVGGCVSLSSFGVYYIPDVAKDNIFVSLMFMDGAGLPVEKVFDNQYMKIYRIIYSPV